MNPDFVDLLRAFAAAEVRCLVVGAYALAHHGRPRATGDLDVWILIVDDNAINRDILTELTGLSFEDAWPDREPGTFGGLTVDFIGLDAFIRNKRATGRTKDLGDIEGL